MKRSILFFFFFFFFFCKSKQESVNPNPQNVQENQAYLGILYIETSNGIQVAEVFPDSPASKSGIEPGDFILSANGYPVVGSYTLRENIFSLKPGTEVYIEVIKLNGKKTVLKATLEPIPEKYKHKYNIK